ncbi:uncharacterized protein LOC126693582 [Quercus robur]|uniref:uncharacterized protein LOC126693582 n=1 Tax=Quercus robur TaxID=38942 RepID=UPI00216332E4|nr:uncharacterized protein LOC126693582 [Quercus robur]
MATTNNAQEDEPLRSIALERQVQTLMTAVERLTKQNHDLEEQLCQRDAGPNLQEQNQEGNSAERREQEKPESSNAPSRPERQNNDPKTMTDVLYRATKYMNAEDALLAREEKPKKRERQEDTRQDRGRKVTRIGDQRDEKRSRPPTGRFTNFTPLTALIDQVLMQIKDEGALTFPGKLKGDPNKRLRDKQGKLQRFVSRERTDTLEEQAPRRENERPRPPIGDIRMIVGGTAAIGSSKKARKTYLRTVHSVQLIGSIPKMPRIDNPVKNFSEDDARRLHHPHDDTLVVSLQIGDYNMHWVLVDNGSSADILYYLALQQMRIDKERFSPTNAPLVGFGGTKVFPLGAITLAVTAGDYPQQITKEITFLVVDCSSAYNAILGRPTLNS